MRFSKTLMSFVAIAVCILLGFTSSSMAQFRYPQDSLPAKVKKDSLQHPVGLLEPKSLGVQFLCGEIAYAIPIWTLVYPAIQRHKRQFSYGPGPMALLGMTLAWIGPPLGADLILKALGWKSSDFRFGFGGSLLGAVIARLIIPSDKVYVNVLYSGVASVLTSMLFYDISGLIWPDEPK